MSRGRLILIPAALSDANPGSMLPQATVEVLFHTKVFIAERAKTARHYLKSIAYPHPMSEISVFELNKHGDDDVRHMLSPCLAGHDCGLISEAGVPGVADPGEHIVRAAHEIGIEVMPLVGPSSLLLALMSCGMNGQRFSFHGYLAKDENALSVQLRQLESESVRDSVTQMFIETPYRNEKMMGVLMKSLHPDTLLCVAANLTASNQFILTKKIAEWKRLKFNFDRKPAVFLIFAGKI